MQLLHSGALDLWWTQETLHDTPELIADILDGYLLPHKSPRIVKNANGKPSLGPASALTFNISRSSGLVLAGVRLTAPVGVDCELARMFDDMDGVADLSFTQAERAWIEHGVESPVARFFKLWTRKEAVVKAIGLGLQIPLNSFEVLADDVAVAVSTVVPGHGRWWVASIDAPPGVVAACASLTSFTPRLRRRWPAPEA